MTKAEASVSSSRSSAAEAVSHASVAVRATEGGHSVIFFDGVCGLCNRFVDFVIRHDRQGVFRLAPLQGETARDRLAEADVVDLKTVVLVDLSGTYRKSTAVLRVLGRLGGFWKFAAALLWVIPRPIRDLGYSWIAANRYAIFGRKETCRLPSAAERERFLP
jgi:predicted DCC family thiol-disulfide oxidoreductase YuxK